MRPPERTDAQRICFELRALPKLQRRDRAMLAVVYIHSAPVAASFGRKTSNTILEIVVQMKGRATVWWPHVLSCMQSPISSVNIHASAHRHTSVRKDRRSRKACP